MKKYATYALGGIDELRSFLSDYLGLRWIGEPPQTPNSRIVFFSDLKMNWVHANNLPNNFTVLEYKNDRTKLLYVLKKMYGDKLSIPDNTIIHLSDERIELIEKSLQYYKDINNWQDNSTIAKLERIIDDRYYSYKDRNMLNKLVKQYKDKQKPSGGVASKSKGLDVGINDLVGKVQDGTIDPTDDTFKKLMNELRKQRELDKQDKRKSNPWIPDDDNDETPQKYWRDTHGDGFKETWDKSINDAIDEAREYHDTTSTSDESETVVDKKISSDQNNDAGWMGMAKDFISDMWKGDK